MTLLRQVLSRSTVLTLLASSVPISAQSGPTGRTMFQLAPAVIGQTAEFALRHPVAIAGNGYAILFSAPNFPFTLQLHVPGVTIRGLLRVEPATMVVIGTGVMDASGQTAALPIAIPNVPGLVGFTFDLQGVDIGGAAAITFSDNDVELVVAGSPGPDMQAIPAGTFQMGSNAPSGIPYWGQTLELPVHQVTITRPFWMGRHEVTQAEWQAVMGTNPSRFVGPQRPVEQVSWNEAVAYCVALTNVERTAGRVPTGYQYRLPTEAEWEYCCRAGTTTEFAFGATIGCGQANFGFNYHTGSSCSISRTANVGSYPANSFGLHDMHGNVSEWCQDSWDGSSNYPSGSVYDPLVTSGFFRVARGGGWDADSSFCRSADRFNGGGPGIRYDFLGFRVALAPVLVP